MAHTAGASLRLGVDEKKLEAVWEYRSSPLYTEAERVALDFAIAAASQPNDVTDELFARMRPYVDGLARVETHGAHMIEKNERTDGAPRCGRQKTPDFKTVAEVFGICLKDLADHNVVGGAESGMCLIIDG